LWADWLRVLAFPQPLSALFAHGRQFGARLPDPSDGHALGGYRSPAELPRSGTALIIQLLWNYFFVIGQALSPPPSPARTSSASSVSGRRRVQGILDRVDEERLLRASFTRAEALELVRAYLEHPPLENPALAWQGRIFLDGPCKG